MMGSNQESEDAIFSLDLSPEMFSGESNYKEVQGEIPIETREEGVIFREVTYEEVQGYAVIEGDIVLGTLEEVQRREKGIAIVGEEYRWGGDKIHFKFDGPVRENFRQRVLLGIDEWEYKTPFYFVELEEGDEADVPDYLVFHAHETLNNSRVGRHGGAQTINIHDQKGTVGNVIHEIGHALGLWHEQSRHDRDEHIEILWDNVIKGKDNHNFWVRIDDGFDIGPYDYGSIMHYHAWAFAVDRTKPTILTKQKVPIGQRNGLSNGDVEAIRKIYPESKISWAKSGRRKRQEEANKMSGKTGTETAPEPQPNQVEQVTAAALEYQKRTEAELAALKAQLPGTTEPLKGEIKTDSASGYLAELAAYDAMLVKTDEISAAVEAKIPPGSVVMIVDSLDVVSGDVNLLQLEAQVAYWQAKLTGLNNQLAAFIAAAGQPGDAPAADPLALAAPLLLGIKTAADIAGYFQMNFDIKGKTVNKDELPLKLRLIQKITTSAVRLPTFYQMADEPEIIKTILACIKLKTDLTQKKSTLPKPDDDDKKLAALLAEVAQVIQSFDAFLTTITTSAEGAHSPLVKAAIRQDFKNKGITHLLYIAMTSAGGESIASQFLWFSGRMSYLGGGIISYVCADISGNILISGAEICSSYLKFNLRGSEPPTFSSSK